MPAAKPEAGRLATSKILIVDDHPLLRRGLASLIESEADLMVCGEAATDMAALEAIQEVRPHLVIVDLQLERLNGLLAERRLTLEITDAARRSLAEAGYDPAYGARPLRRAIQRMIQDPLALELLKGGFAPGDRILVDHGADGITLEKAAAAAASEGI